MTPKAEQAAFWMALIALLIGVALLIWQLFTTLKKAEYDGDMRVAGELTLGVIEQVSSDIKLEPGATVVANDSGTSLITKLISVASPIFYVASSGEEHALGTADDPFASIQVALDHMNELVRGGQSTVIVKGTSFNVRPGEVWNIIGDVIITSDRGMAIVETTTLEHVVEPDVNALGVYTVATQPDETAARFVSVVGGSILPYTCRGDYEICTAGLLPATAAAGTQLEFLQPSAALNLMGSLTIIAHEATDRLTLRAVEVVSAVQTASLTIGNANFSGEGTVTFGEGSVLQASDPREPENLILSINLETHCSFHNAAVHGRNSLVCEYEVNKPVRVRAVGSVFDGMGIEFRSGSSAEFVDVILGREGSGFDMAALGAGSSIKAVNITMVRDRAEELTACFGGTVTVQNASFRSDGRPALKNILCRTGSQIVMNNVTFHSLSDLGLIDLSEGSSLRGTDVKIPQALEEITLGRVGFGCTVALQYCNANFVKTFTSATWSDSRKVDFMPHWEIGVESFHQDVVQSGAWIYSTQSGF